jgi:hypothetical protein
MQSPGRMAKQRDHALDGMRCLSEKISGTGFEPLGICKFSRIIWWRWIEEACKDICQKY